MSDTVGWHERSTEETLALLRTSRSGLSLEEATRRHAEYGPNALDEAPPRPAIRMLLAQFNDFTIVILIAAAVIAGFLGDVADTLVITAIVVLNGIIGFVQEMRSERAMAALRALAAPSATVLRAGYQRSIAASELVPGDAVILEAGAIVPADIRLIDVSALRVNESALTGESVAVDKSTGAVTERGASVGDRRNIAHKGTIVTYGRALGIVIATGMRTT